MSGIEQRNDRDGADVVDNRDGQQQQPQRGRGAAAEQGQHANREGNVGRRRDRPAGAQCGIAAAHCQIDQRRNGHARYGRQHRQSPPGWTCQLAVQHLAFYLEADREEEQRHQGIVGPAVKVGQWSDWRPGQRIMQRGVIGVRSGRIGQQQGQRSCGDQQQTRARFAAPGAAQRAGNPVRDMTALRHGAAASLGMIH